MAITVKHSKVSTIPDDADTSLVRPSDWNADHTLVGTVPVANGGTGAATLTGYVKGNGTSTMTASATIPSTDVTGLGTMSTQNSNNISVTGGSMSGVTISDYIPTSQKAAALGVATLDAGGTVPINQLPAAVLGALSYQGTWDASTNTPTLTSSVGTKGYYYVVSVAGSTNLNGITDWKVGDWAVYNGTAWQKIDNTDAVTSVNGYTGTVVLTNTDISGFGTMSTQNANAVAITGGTINGTTIGATTASTGAFTTVTASTSLTTPTVQATNSGGLALKNSAGTTQMSMGAGGGDNMSINVSTNINGTNAQIDISPTGTGHVHIKPSGANSVEIAPTSVGTMDNMTIGATTPKNASFVDLSVTGTTSFDGSQGTAGQVLTSAGTGATPTWTTPTTGTVTSVTGTSPVVSSGGTTPAISMPAATSSVNGYLTSTDWNTFNNKGSGTVTSVSATAPITSSGGATPNLAMPAATTSVNGYLTSTDWTTFNGKGSGTVTSASVVSANGFAGTVATATTTPAITISTSITGVIKGNGTAISAATAGTDYVAPGTSTSFTALQTFLGSSSVAAFKTANIVEPATISATAATGTINYDVTTQSVLYYTSNASANWTVNVRGSSGTSLNTLLAVGDTIAVTFMVTQGSTAYYNNAFQVDGSSVTPKWQGGTAPTSGNASGIDVYNYVIVKTASATFTVLASQSQFK
jgi:hypothetical protein